MNFTTPGSRVLITGAAMGMGKLYAHRAVAEGAAVVVLWDINKDALTETAAQLRAEAGSTTVIEPMVVDISERTAIEKAARKVIATHGGVDAIINNAGIVRGTYFWDHVNDTDTELTMKINALAPMYITGAFLPGMIERKAPARIMNIASAAGFIGNPKMSVYASSKWALIGWGESVRLELVQQGFGHVKVTTVCPTYISTGMFDGVKGPLFTPIMKPEYVVGKAWKAMKSGKPMLMMPWTVHLSKFLKGVLPGRWFDAIAGRIFGVYNTMDHFTGRG